MKKHLDPEKIRLAKEMARAIPDFLETVTRKLMSGR
jgi:hypothetical protein